MEKTIYKVTPESRGERLDTYISLRCDITRSYLQKLIKQGFVTVNRRVEKTSYKVRTNDFVEIIIPDKPEEVLTPENIPLDIIWEDDQIIAVNKPPHMVVYPAAGNLSGTLMNALIYKCDVLCPVGAPLRPGVVHRLDKDTSGLIVIAKDRKAYYNLVDQFREREIEKYYMALVFGSLKEKAGEIKRMIGRSSADRKKMSTRTRRGKEAVTRFEVIERFKVASLVKVKILTGRTHQIRVHLASIGHPVLGDKTYGRKTSLKFGQKTIQFPRQMLHAYSLKLRHPAKGESMEFTALLPEDMKRAIEELRMMI